MKLRADYLKESYTYEKSGVSVKKAKKAHNLIGELIKETFKLRKGELGGVVGDYGHYAGLIDIGNNNCLALHADGVGTKVLIAQLMNKYDTIGIDLVAMNANDLICMGAEPVCLVDYLAVEKIDEEMISEIIKGVVAGAKKANMTIIGGETAIMPDVIKGAVEGKGFDLSAMSAGIVQKEKIITGEQIKADDIIFGLESNGIHSNALTLARKTYLEKAGLKISDQFGDADHSIGEELLKPTEIYVGVVLDIIKSIDVHGLAHITGGAFSKLMRLSFKEIGFELKSLPEPPLIFQDIKKIANISTEEAYRTFNMGIGFCIITSSIHLKALEKICKKHKINGKLIGKIIDKKGVFIKDPLDDPSAAFIQL
ncbi:MAG: phosphoribosylformylglycinamidine cyclo-ligase [Promethearchaeota archaeon]